MTSLRRMGGLNGTEREQIYVRRPPAKKRAPARFFHCNHAESETSIS